MKNEIRIKRIINDIAHDYRDMHLSEADLKDLLEYAIKAINCSHICTSECRRTGCNCDCGEYHY